MDITVKEVEELPAHTFLSVRYGESRKQGPFRVGEAFSFAGKAEKLPKAFTVDVFRKVGSKQVSLAGITAMGGSIRHDHLEIPSLDIQGAPVKTSLEACWKGTSAEKGAEPRPSKQAAAAKAREYLEQHQVQSVLQDMFAQLLEQKPQDPLAFMSDFIDRKRDEAEAAEGADEVIDLSQEPGLGAEALPGFGVGQALPDLAKHNSIVTDVLKKSPEVYAELAERKTSTGVALATCIKAGVDFPGHPLVKVGGAYAGDADCYELFRGVFDPVIAALHPGWSPDLFGEHNRHPLDANTAKLTNTVVDSSEGRYAVFASLEVRRNFSGLPFPACCSVDQRRKVESILTSTSGLRGSYLPLRGSQSFEGKLGGMAVHQEDRLRNMGMLFSEPDSQMKLAAGLGRHWPDARGVFVGDAPGMLVWCNEEDHVRFFARQQGVDLKQLFARLVKALASVEEAGRAAGHEYCSSKRLGYLTADPVRLGCSLKATVSLKLPLLGSSVDVPELCHSLELQCSDGGAAASGLWHVHSSDCLAISEVDILNITMQGCKRLVALEQRLENGEPIFDALPGLGSELLPGILPESSCPRRMPDISTCKSVVAACLRSDSGLYTRLRTLKTSGSVGLGRCIRGAMDKRSSGATLSTGLVAGDEECLDTFKELFDAVLARLPSLASLPSTASSTPLEATESHCSWVRADLRRNVAGIKLASCCNREERREVERLLVKALTSDGVSSIPGQYLALSYSQSCPLCMGGVSLEEQSSLRLNGTLFAEPRDIAAIDAGVGRDWPDARGAVKLPGAGDAVAWINESDHLLLRSRMSGADLSAAFKHAQGLADGIETVLKADGRSFAKHQQFGFVSLDALHLGSGLQLTAALRLPKLSACTTYPQICARLGLTEIWRDGLTEVSCYPAPSLAAEDMLERARQNIGVLVQLEKRLAEGADLDEELAALGLTA